MIPSGAATEYTDAETGFVYLRARYYITGAAGSAASYALAQKGLRALAASGATREAMDAAGFCRSIPLALKLGLLEGLADVTEGAKRFINSSSVLAGGASAVKTNLGI